MIPVTKPYLPSIEEYQQHLHGIWEREWLTNNGLLVQKLENSLCNYLDVKSCLYVSNGTIAIQLALKATGLFGEVITTPFSYIATTSSLVWENCVPVFVDIDSETFNINPSKIEQAITPKTTGILATHVFGNPCDIDAITAIAKKYDLTVIYDAAHCFGTTYQNKSVFEFGDVCTTSFHATKLFHSIEGGAVFCNNESLFQRMYYMRNFGHDGPEKFNGVGINAKNSEFHAAMGLCILDHMNTIMKTRKAQWEKYYEQLHELPVHFQKQLDQSESNLSYFPLVFESEATTLRIKNSLENKQIFTRRYFYPSLNTLDYTRGVAPISESISSRILCLPLYHTLSVEEQNRVITSIIEAV